MRPRRGAAATALPATAGTIIPKRCCSSRLRPLAGFCVASPATSAWARRAFRARNAASVNVRWMKSHVIYPLSNPSSSYWRLTSKRPRRSAWRFRRRCSRPPTRRSNKPFEGATYSATREKVSAILLSGGFQDFGCPADFRLRRPFAGLVADVNCDEEMPDVLTCASATRPRATPYSRSNWMAVTAPIMPVTTTQNSKCRTTKSLSKKMGEPW